MVASSILQGSSFPTLEQKFALRNILHTFPFQDVTRIENRENQQETKNHISHQEDMMLWLSGPVHCMKRIFVFVLGV